MSYLVLIFLTSTLVSFPLQNMWDTVSVLLAELTVALRRRKLRSYVRNIVIYNGLRHFHSVPT